MATQFGIYQTGTLAIGAGATSAVGSGTFWLGGGIVKPGDWLMVAGVVTIIEAEAVDNTHLTIPAWAGAAVPPGTPYKIYQVSPDRYAGGSYGNDISRIVASLNTEGFYVFVPNGQTEPDPSLGEENQFALQASTGKLWVKSGGIWIYEGLFAAITPKGAWDNTANYTVGNSISFNGSSYVALQNSTNVVPTNAAYWQLLAAKGETGALGPVPWAATSTWASGTSYVVGPPASIIVHPTTKNIYQCIVAHTSAPSSFAADLAAAKWLLIGQGLTEGTSATSITIGTGNQTFATQVGLSYQNGVRLRVSSNGSPTNWMEGICTYSFDGTGGTLTMTVDKTNGAGTFTDWNFNRCGVPGSGDLSSSNYLSELSGNKSLARSNIGINQGVALAAATDFNTVLNEGSYYTTDAASTNTPTNGLYWYLQVRVYSGPTYIKQTATVLNGTDAVIYERVRINSVWKPWHVVLFGDDNLGSLTDKAAARSNLGANIASGRYNVLSQDGFIDNTGATDTSARLLAAIAAIYASGAKAYIPPGLYNTGSAQINIPDNAELELHKGATLRRTADPAAFGTGSPLIALGNYSKIRGGTLDNTTIYCTASDSRTLASSGTITFNVPAGLTFPAAWVRCTTRSNRSYFMEGNASISGTTLTVTPKFQTGTGTYADWDICQGNAWNCAIMAHAVSDAIAEEVAITNYFYIGAMLEAVNAAGSSALLNVNCLFKNLRATGILNRPFYMYGNIADCIFDGLYANGAGISQYGINLNPSNNSGTSNTIQRNKIRGCRVISSQYQGYEIAENSNYNTFIDCQASFVTQPGSTAFVQQIANSGTTPNANDFIGCEAHACTYGFALNGASGGKYIGCSATANTNIGFYVNDAQVSQLMTFAGCRSQNNGASGVYFGAKAYRLDWDGGAAISNSGYGFWAASGSQQNYVTARAYANTSAPNFDGASGGVNTWALRTS